MANMPSGEPPRLPLQTVQHIYTQCRVLAILQDPNQRVVAYGQSNSSYGLKAHPRGNGSKRKRTAPDPGQEISEQAAERPRKKPRHADHTTVGAGDVPSIMTARNSNTSHSPAAGSSLRPEPHQNVTSGPPQADTAHTTANPSTPFPLQWPPETSLHTNAISEPPPTLTEVVPSNYNWRGGIRVSLYIDNLPSGGSVYARFGSVVVSTVHLNQIESLTLTGMNRCDDVPTLWCA